MAGLNYLVELTSIEDFINDHGEVRDLLGDHTMVIEVRHDHNGMPHVMEILDRSTGQDIFFDGPAKGYIGTSLKHKDGRQYLLSLGTPDHAYSTPFARWACDMVEQGVGLLRADEEASLEGEAADVHERALTLPQVKSL